MVLTFSGEESRFGGLLFLERGQGARGTGASKDGDQRLDLQSGPFLFPSRGYELWLSCEDVFHTGVVIHSSAYFVDGCLAP